MEFIKPAVVPTADGSPTLADPVSGDTYHSVNGAVQESLHVFIREGFGRCDKQCVSVFEAGFGSGLNAWLTAREAVSTGKKVRYTAVELHPVDPVCLTVANGFPADGIFESLHLAPWGKETAVCDNFSLCKIHADLAGCVFDTKFDVVYFDMFAPDTHPWLWTEEIFRIIASSMLPGASLVTYSAKGDVKRALRAAGFEVYRLPGAPGKRHMLRALINSGLTT